LAVAEHYLGAIEAESFDAETDFSIVWFGEREFIELEDIGVAGLVETNDLYGVGHVGSLFLLCLV
jgi:hypothetical protein